MRKQWLSECRLSLTLAIPKGARLLVAEGKKKDAQDNLTVPVRSAGHSYLPGSSLKGVLRSRAEYIAHVLRSHAEKNGRRFNGPATCDIFDLAERNAPLSERLACSERFDLRAQASEENFGELSTFDRHAQSCPACQLFGHTYAAGRFKVTDFELEPGTNEHQVRQTHVVIDRLTGGAAPGRLFDMEYLTRTNYSGEIVLENFSLWHLGWLGMLVRDLQEGWICLGHKQTTGTGRLKIVSARARLRCLGQQNLNGELLGLGALLAKQTAPTAGQGYDLSPSDRMALPGLHWEWVGLYAQAELDAMPGAELWNSTRSRAQSFLMQFEFAPEMQLDRLDSLRSHLSRVRRDQ